MRRTFTRMGVGAAVIALTVGTATAAGATAAPFDPAAAQAAVDRLAKDGGQGVQGRVVVGGRTYLLRGGTAEYGEDRPVPLDGRFRIGSVTKVLTSTTLLRLAGAGQVGLDDPVGRHLPGLLPDGDRITVRMLLQHTSGLFDYTRTLDTQGAGFQRIRFLHREPAELVGIATARPLEFPPGTRHSYSNTNYIVAGLLIEKVTGRTYEQAVTAQVLRPAGLRETTLPRDNTTIPGPHAHGYDNIDGDPIDVTRLNPTMAWSAGGAISTTADLDRLMTALLDGTLLTPAQVAELTRTLPFSEGYGLGFMSMTLPCGVTVWGHGGGIPGYSTMALTTLDRAKRLAVSVSHSPLPGGADGYQDLLNLTFC